MFSRIKSLLNTQFDKMQNFDSNNETARVEISKRNIDFSNDLSKKISVSQKRISNIKSSIQNTKL